MSKEANKKIVALIPLRGGSKRIPYKNIKSLAGKPLAYWVISEALKSEKIGGVYVSTEDKKIRRVIQKLGLNVTIIDRPVELAADTTPEELVHLHFLDQVPFDILVILHATNPLTQARDLDRAIEQFEEKGFDSMITGTSHKHFYWTHEGKPLNYDPQKRPRTQDFKGTITENGAFYITRPSTLKRYKNFLGGKTGVYEMRPEQDIDIDNPSDWNEAKKRFKKTRKP